MEDDIQSASSLEKIYRANRSNSQYFQVRQTFEGEQEIKVQRQFSFNLKRVEEGQNSEWQIKNEILGKQIKENKEKIEDYQQLISQQDSSNCTTNEQEQFFFNRFKYMRNPKLEMTQQELVKFVNSKDKADYGNNFEKEEVHNQAVLRQLSHNLKHPIDQEMINKSMEQFKEISMKKENQKYGAYNNFINHLRQKLENSQINAVILVNMQYQEETHLNQMQDFALYFTGSLNGYSQLRVNINEASCIEDLLNNEGSDKQKKELLNFERHLRTIISKQLKRSLKDIVLFEIYVDMKTNQA